MTKAILYLMLLPFTIWSMEGLNFNKLFKQNRVYQARVIYLMIAISLTYFLYDFFINFKII